MRFGHSGFLHTIRRSRPGALTARSSLQPQFRVLKFKPTLFSALSLRKVTENLFGSW